MHGSSMSDLCRLFDLTWHVHSFGSVSLLYTLQLRTCLVVSVDGCRVALCVNVVFATSLRLFDNILRCCRT